LVTQTCTAPEYEDPDKVIPTLPLFPFLLTTTTANEFPFLKEDT